MGTCCNMGSKFHMAYSEYNSRVERYELTINTMRAKW